MKSGWSNKLVGQAGEFAVCAELAKRGYIATPFAGNVPGFDVLATDERFRTVPIQVKANFGKGSWQSRIDDWLEMEFDPATGIQRILGLKENSNPDLIMVYVWLCNLPEKHDRFFVLRKRDLQPLLRAKHAAFLGKHGGRRPQSPKSYHTAIRLAYLEPFEDNWGLVSDLLQAVVRG